MPITDYGIVFDGVDVVAIVLPYTIAPPDLQVWRTQFAATHGVSEIIGGSGGRSIELPLVLRKASYRTRTDIEDAMNALDALVGVHGELRIYLHDGSQVIYPDCTCHGFQRMSDPKPDEAGTMGAGVGRWTVQVMARFYETLVIE